MGWWTWRRALTPWTDFESRPTLFPQLRPNMVWFHEARRCPHQNPVFCALTRTHPGHRASFKLCVSWSFLPTLVDYLKQFDVPFAFFSEISPKPTTVRAIPGWIQWKSARFGRLNVVYVSLKGFLRLNCPFFIHPCMASELRTNNNMATNSVVYRCRYLILSRKALSFSMPGETFVCTTYKER